MEEEVRDQRFRRLSTIGAVINFIAAILALTATVSIHWSKLSGAISGYMGLFRICQDILGSSDKCHKSGLGPYRRTWTGYVAGVAAILCLLFLSMGALLSILVVAMHHAQHSICLKFRHAAFTRTIMSAAAAVSALISVVCFIIETKIFLPIQSENARSEFSWSFYIEVSSFFLSVILGAITVTEWSWSRKVGGDPTVYTRDPEGTKADTIVNPNFREAPRAKDLQMGRALFSGGPGRSGGVQRNTNGIAMTKSSGLPYMVTNGSRGGPHNGHISNGRPALHVPYDPNKTPLRSSLRRPKPAPVPSEDLTDSDIALQNPSFANNSPQMKKKVRIHTQSTAV